MGIRWTHATKPFRAAGRAIPNPQPLSPIPLQNAHLAVVAQGQLVGLRLDRRARDDGIAADQAVLNARGDIADARAFQDDRAPDLAVLDRDVVEDRRERADVAVHDARVLADDGRA